MIPCYHITHISHLAITFSEIFELEDVISPHPFLKVTHTQTKKKHGKLRSPRIVGWFNPAVLWFNVAPKKSTEAKLHMARALIMNPEILILEKPLMTLGSMRENPMRKCGVGELGWELSQSMVSGWFLVGGVI